MNTTTNISIGYANSASSTSSVTIAYGVPSTDPNGFGIRHGHAHVVTPLIVHPRERNPMLTH